MMYSPASTFGQGGFLYRSPSKTSMSYSSFNNTPTRLKPVAQLNNHNPYDIKQVAQIFENMKLEVINSSPLP